MFRKLNKVKEVILLNELKIFKNSEFGEIRTVEIDGEPWFVGKDVAEILGYANPSKALSDHVDEEDKLNNESLSSLGQRGGWLINESGLYSLILSSKLSTAKKFKRWVTSEVLPSIRRTGAYGVQVPRTLKEALQLALEQEEKLEALQLDNSIKTQQIAELQPKATYYDLILQCRDLLSMTEIAKDYGMSAKGLNKRLHELGVQYNQSGVWFLYAKYQSEGYTQTKTQNYNKPDGSQGARTHMYWTQKGRLFLYDFLKSNGILPLIEKVG
jgi:hypothetical protein